MSWLWFWMALIGMPAAMRPMTGTETVRLSMTVDGGGARSRLRLPSMTLGWKPGRCGPGRRRWFSGRRMTSMARARCGRRRMNPRSTSAVIRRWMPDLDLRSSASFISSNDGGTPLSCMRAWMKSKSSFCFSVSIWPSPFSARGPLVSGPGAPCVA